MRLIIKLLIITLFFVFVRCAIRSQEYLYLKYNPEGEQKSIKLTLQDYTWFGSITFYPENNVVEMEKTTTLFVDQDGQLWDKTPDNYQITVVDTALYTRYRLIMWNQLEAIIVETIGETGEKYKDIKIFIYPLGQASKPGI